MTLPTTALNTCALWGTTSYVNSWLWINILVILGSLLAIAVAYSLSSFFPASTRGKLRGFVRFEMIQMVISIAIIAALLSFAAAACNVSTSMTQSISGTSLNPFQFSEHYLATTFNGGLTLLSNIYSTSIAYSVYATGIRLLTNIAIRGFNLAAYFKSSTILTKILTRTANKGGIIPTPGSLIGSFCDSSKICEYETIPSNDFSTLYNLFAGIYIDIYAPILITAIGLLLIQFLAVPVMQYTAFTIVLPVAIGMRSIAFFSSGIGDASNALIAIAVALYIIYPMMVAFDSYAMAWVFSANNPTHQYLASAFNTTAVQPNAYLQATPNLNSSDAIGGISQELSFLTGAFAGSYKFYAPSLSWLSTTRTYTDDLASFFFQGVMLMALNIAVTMGLAMSLYKALKSGLGEAGRFW